MSKFAKKIALGAIFAAIAGYIAGLLTAPKSGKETRGDIKKTAGKAATTAEEKLQKLHGELDELITKAQGRSNKLGEQAKDQLGVALGKANTAKGKAQEVLAAVKTGTAEDKDLKKAMREAAKAVDSLKAYLKKS